MAARMDIPVLVVGRGPVGLTASMLLSRFGVPSLLVERHPGTAVHPKARAINARTMEMYRQCGVETAIRAAGLPPERARFIIWSRTLAGEEIERRIPWRASAGSQSGQRFPLMAGPHGRSWADAARGVADALGVPIATHTIDGDSLRDPDGAWTRTYGVDDTAAVLVRPDGYVAWRSPSRAAAETLGTAVERMVGRR